MTYTQFLTNKVKKVIDSGLDVIESELNPNLFGFQKFIVKRALEVGRYAIFADCGLGKTLMQLSFADYIVKKENIQALILCPLAVAGQTIKEGAKFGVTVQKYNNQIVSGIYILNYEQIDNFDMSDFDCIILDESSILKSFTGKMRTKLIDTFADTKYKLACTATPSPNDLMEIGNHSEFLNVMSRSEMLAMYFNHDGGDSGKWRLKGHAQNRFWSFVSNWAIMINKPSDIGFDDDGYCLPTLNLIEYKLETEKRANGLLFNDLAVSATNFNTELKLTMADRLNKVAEIVNNSDENFIIWIKQNEEGQLLRRLIPDSVEVKGSDSIEHKEDKLLGFADNKFRVLITKSKIAQFGLNYQNCNNQVFAALDFSFEGLYQSIRRSYRFGQKKEVNIHLITTDTMTNVIESINRKRKDFEIMQGKMSEATKKNYKEIIQFEEIKTIDVKKDKYTFLNGDCVQRIKELPDNSIDFSIFSPPFADLYVYSDKLEDMGNSKDYNEFFKHFNYLIPELFRVVKPGRLVAIHCMDLPIKKSTDGFIGLRDFSGLIINAFQDAGFIYHDRITIWKDPVVEMQRTKALGLLHKQLKKDSSMSRTGTPDYLLVFRMPGENKDPIANKNIPVDLWQKYASPVWYDINYSDTLQFRTAKAERDEKHICPLQLQTIERAITLWTNEGDTVLSPFGGIGSEGYQALKMGRKYVGIELKESYFNLGKRNLELAIKEEKQMSLLDLAC